MRNASSVVVARVTSRDRVSGRAMNRGVRLGVWSGRLWMVLLVSVAVMGVFAGAARAASRSWSAPVVLATGSFAPLSGIACPTVGQCSVVDASGEAAFNPVSPGTPTPTRVGGSEQLSAVACPSARQCTAVDNSGREVTFDPRSPGSGTRSQIDGFPPTLAFVRT